MEGNFRIREWLIEPKINNIRGTDKSTHVEPKIMQVLVCLARHAGEVVTKERLIQSVWPDTFVTDDVLTRSISELRKAFGDDSKEPRFIQTIPRSGYRLVAPVFDEPAQAPVDSGSAVADSETIAAAPHRPWHRINFLRRESWLLKLSAALALMMGVAAWIYSSRPTAEPSLPPMKTIRFTSFAGVENWPSFSPDGNQIAFAWSGEKDDNEDIYVKHLRADSPLRLTTHPGEDYSPVWAPDGSHIAFIRVSETEYAVFLVPALGGAERKVVSLGPASNWGRWYPGLAWSPDGKFLACPEKPSPVEPVRIFLLSPETGDRRTLTFPPVSCWGDWDSFSFSPDSQTLAFTRYGDAASSELYIVSVTGGEPKQLTFDNERISGSAWTPDGLAIVFSSSRDGVRSLWKIPVSGGAPERLTIGGDNATGPMLSRRGDRLAFSSFNRESDIWRIAVPDATNPNPSPSKFISSTQHDYAPQYSPDGERIAFESARTGNHEIWMCDRDGANLVRLTSLGAWAGTPRWSPDGRQIAFDLHAKSDDADIYVVSADGGAPRRLTTGAADKGAPSWSRDGQWIYFGANHNGDQQVWKIPAAGGEAAQVTKHGGFFAFESPDGKFVYYAKGLTLPGIWRVPVAGGEETPVLDRLQLDQWGNWAVVKEGIYFLNPEAKDGAAIEFFSFVTRRVTNVARIGKAPLFPHGLAVSPDRRWILYTLRRQYDSDILLVENFR